MKRRAKMKIKIKASDIEKAKTSITKLDSIIDAEIARLSANIKDVGADCKKFVDNLSKRSGIK